MEQEQFIFTSDNLIENLDKIGAWSSYALATEALQHYFPSEYDEDGNCKGGVFREAELVMELGGNYWNDVIIKYQNEVGYNAPTGFSTNYVNEY